MCLWIWHTPVLSHIRKFNGHVPGLTWMHESSRRAHFFTYFVMLSHIYMLNYEGFFLSVCSLCTHINPTWLPIPTEV